MTDLLSVTPDILYCVNRKCGADWVIERGVIDFHDLTYVLSGSGVYSADGVEEQVTAGDVIYIPPGTVRQAWTAANDLMDLFAINFMLTANVTSDDDVNLPFRFVSNAGFDVKIISLFSQLTRVWMEKENLYQVDARGISLLIICELARKLCGSADARRYEERVEQVKKYINENYNKQLSMSSMAKQVGLNPVYLGSLFMKHELCSVKEYINKIRINHALEIIKTENLPIGDVALGCGFSDAFYFSKIFKEYIGMPPSWVRRKNSDKNS